MIVQDVYGNTYTYGHLGSVAKTYPSPKRRTKKASTKDAKRRGLAAAATTEHETKADAKAAKGAKATTAEPAGPTADAAPTAKVRLFAHPTRKNALANGGDAQVSRTGGELAAAGAPLGLNPKDFVAKRLVKGARVLGGTTLGRIGKTNALAPHLLFEIRPAGRGAPRIDPKPILDGWKLLESTEVYRAKGKNALFGADADAELGIGQIMLMSKETLARRVLADNRITIYGCGESDIRSGAIDRRVLATLEFLASSGLRPTVSSLKCGHGYMTASGNVSEHSTGTAVDIAAINGINIYGHQGPGSIADVTIQRLLTLQGTMKPHQIISLMTFKDADNTLAMADHADHIHVGWRPLYGENKASREADQRDPEAEPVDQADRPPVRDRQPDGPDRPQQVLHQGQARRRLRSGAMSTADTKAQIETAIKNFQREVPALERLKLVFELELRGRGDIQLFRVEVPGPKITRDIASDAKVRLSIPRTEFNELLKDGTIRHWRECFESGHVKASGPPEIIKLIANVVLKQEERTRTRRLRTRSGG